MMKFGLDRAQFTIHLGILGMRPDRIVQFESKVEHRSPLWQIDRFTLWSENRNILVVKRTYHTVHEPAFGSLAGRILQQGTELGNPVVPRPFHPFNGTPQLGVEYHTFGRDMDFFPNAMLAKQTDMETLITVLLGRVDKVDDAARFFLETVGQDGIDVQTDALFIFFTFGRINQPDYMTVIQMLEVTPGRLYLPPDAVRHTIAHFRTRLNAFAAQQLQHFAGKGVQTLTVFGFVGFDGSFQFLILQRTTVA